MLLLALSLSLCAAPAQNLVVVTLDGVRPEELFTGAERRLMRGVEEEAGLVERYWRPTPRERREALLPFFWKTLAPQGQVFGDRSVGSPMRVENRARVSYPGYAELFSGWADPRIRANDFGANPNTTVLEWLARQPGLEGQVEVFASWDTFHRIFADARTGLPVHAGLEAPFAREPHRTDAQAAIDQLFETTTPMFGGNALDAMVMTAVFERLRTASPRVLVIALGEPDEWAHAGRYDLTLEALHRADAHLARLWNVLQASPVYRGTTALVVTTDHGRGRGVHWREHGREIDGAEQTWAAVLGPPFEARGVVAHAGPRWSSQLAATMTAALGFDWQAEEPRAAPPLLAPVLQAASPASAPSPTE